MRIKCSRKIPVFYYLAVMCTTTGGTEQIRAGVSRYDYSAWTNQVCQNRGEWRSTSPYILKRRATGHTCPYITVSLVISWFITIDLKRIYCSYSGTQNSEWFSLISVIIFKVNIVAEHVNAKRMTIIVLFYTELRETIFISWYSTSEP